MTTIAWDGKTLAADKRATHGGLIFTVTKIFRIRGYLVGASGDFDRIMETIAWFSDGADPAKVPPHSRSNDEYVGMLVIGPGGLIEKYERGPLPYRIESKLHAIGSGRDFAMAAMYLGKTAIEAVEVATALDTGTGNGVDTLMLEA